MVYKKKEPELTAYQANILRNLTTVPRTFAEIYKATHDPYVDKRAIKLVELGLAARSDVHPVGANKKPKKRARIAWALTEKGITWKEALLQEDAKLSEPVATRVEAVNETG